MVKAIITDMFEQNAHRVPYQLGLSKHVLGTDGLTDAYGFAVTVCSKTLTRCFMLYAGSQSRSWFISQLLYGAVTSGKVYELWHRMSYVAIIMNDESIKM